VFNGTFKNISVILWRSVVFVERPEVHEENKSETVYQRTNTTQWSIEKVQKNKQRSTKHTYKIKDRVTRTPLQTGI
jgi:hypothetical protein